jgi:hypothetical protein
MHLRLLRLLAVLRLTTSAATFLRTRLLGLSAVLRVGFAGLLL